MGSVAWNPHHSLRQSVFVRDHLEKEQDGLQVVVPGFRVARRPPFRGSRVSAPMKCKSLNSAHTPENGAVADELERTAHPFCVFGCQCVSLLRELKSISIQLQSANGVSGQRAEENLS